MIKIKSFLNNESESTINEWLAEKVSDESYIDIKFASILDKNGDLIDKIIVVYKYDPNVTTIEVE